MLIGRNGSGKSNLIEAIVEIFRELELGGAPSFAYTAAVRVPGPPSGSSRPARPSKRLDITVDDKSVTQAAFQRDLDTYLPNYVFAYYSGWSSRLERHFDRPTRGLQPHPEEPRSPPAVAAAVLCRREYSQLVLLAFFLAQASRARELLERYLGITRFESALFVLKRPWWGGKGAPNKTQNAKGDPRFWYARGAFKGFLDRLWGRALAPIRNIEAVERDVRRQGEGTERLYLFIKSEAELAGLKEQDEDSKTLFGYLESLFLCDLIDEVRVTVERTDGTHIKFTQMSEGEQQLMTVLGLLLFTQNDESLYLLDEPDTHLNPVWTYDYLKLLQENIRAEKGQLIIATHNPLMIGSLHKNQVRILAREDSRIVSSEPEYDPIGIGVEGLLKSELYGLRSTLAPEVLAKLDRHYELLGKREKTDAEQAQLMQLARELNELSVSRTHPNPYFDHFANALARRLGAEPEVTLSKEEIGAQARLADEVLKEVLAEEEAGGRGEPA